MKNFRKDFYWALVILIVIACFLFVRSGHKRISTPVFSVNPQVGQMGEPTCQTSGECVHFVKIALQTIKVDLAMDPRTQAQGLSGRISLAEDAGMLFIFPQPSKNYFWMKDMNFPIDMIWIDDHSKVIYIEKNAEPSSYPKTFGPKENSKYVLEVSAGFSEKNNLKQGDSVQFLP